MITSIVVGLMILSAAATISDTQSQEFENRETAYVVENIKEEAGKTDMGPQERRNFERLLGMTDYRSEVTHLKSDNCVNVTLVKPGERLELNELC